MIFRTVLTTLFITLCLGIDTQANESPKQTSIFELQLFERAVCFIKYYEGYGHKFRTGEHYSSNMSLKEADILLRKDLKKQCTIFQRYGKEFLLFAALAYNVVSYRILGSRNKYPKRTLLKKIESGNRDFKSDYV